MGRSEHLEQRVTNLELLFTHLERQVADLHEVLLKQHARIDMAEKQIASLERSLREPTILPSEDET